VNEHLWINAGYKGIVIEKEDVVIGAEPLLLPQYSRWDKSSRKPRRII
jgi:hypothetical protein